MIVHPNFLLAFSIILTTCAQAQTALLPIAGNDTILSTSISSQYLDAVSSKAAQLEQKLDKQTTKALQQWQKQEDRIKRKLAKKDSTKAAAIFGNAEQQYKQLEQKLQSKTSVQQYIPGIDTMASSLKFLQQNPQLLSNRLSPPKGGGAGGGQKLSDAMAKVNGLEEQFQKAEEVNKFLKERKQYLTEQLENMGFAKQIQKLGKLNYYATEQLNEYKSLLKDHKKAEQKALELLSETKLYQNFMQKNSWLASLFRIPGGGDDPSSPLPTSPGGGGLGFVTK